jgi:hypothetical protein
MSATNGNQATQARRFFFYCVAGTIAFFPLVVTSSDLSGLLYFLVAVPIASIVLGILVLQRKGRSRLKVIVTLLAYWLISGLIFRHFSEVRDASRWLFQAKTYKASVLAMPVPPNGDFRHVEWEGWGFAGAGDTTVYLVVDPSDSLSEPAKDHLSGKFKGISCSVYRVHRLEKHWYTVAFYTDTAWGQCE